MNRIFLSLALITNAALGAAAWYGASIDDVRPPSVSAERLADSVRNPAERSPAPALLEARHRLSMHFLIALAAALLVLMLHSIVLTYFMGTGRWLDDAAAAYRLDARLRATNLRLKHRVIPAGVLCMGLVIATGAAGALVDPLSQGTSPRAATIHLTLASTALVANLLVSWWEFAAIRANGDLLTAAMTEVRRIRAERGLD